MSDAKNPYVGLPEHAYWKSGVADLDPLAISGLFRPRENYYPFQKFATAGSCFAQHIGRNLAARGFDVVDAEPAPPWLPQERHHEFGYGLYSARYGNIYTARQLVQTFQRASGALVPVDKVWQQDGRWYDPYRPTIEPQGFASLAEFEALREAHYAALNTMLRTADVFVFTFGLTEAWRNRADGVVYPMCPGTAAGTFDPEAHEFVNFGVADVVSDFEEFMELAREANPFIRFLVTVSPVPLTATGSGDHVLVATMASKSILRAACEELRRAHDDIDYFPSYEIIMSHPMRGRFFEPNLRSVTPEGVSHVMSEFFGSDSTMDWLAQEPVEAAPAAVEPESAPSEADEVCDEMILAQFGPGA